MAHSNVIPIMKPRLPKAEQILPYLEQIDESRWYSNFGPLLMSFEEKLAELFEISPGCLMTASSGTQAISAVLRAMEVEAGTFCVVPSWTFVASAGAPTQVGLEPYFLDVDEQSWALEPEAVKEQLKYIPGRVGAVVVVAPFGAPVEVAKWDAFTEETNVPVIIDAAAAFDSVLNVEGCKIGKTPVMVSMHATKPFGIGEGAFLISNQKLLLSRTRQMTNFGFQADRNIVSRGMNAKLSEYSAAVGLAALNEWPEKREDWLKAQQYYLDAFAKHPSHTVALHMGNDWVTSVCNVSIPPGMSEQVIEQLNNVGIQARKWWPFGCHQLDAYKDCPRFALPVTEILNDTVIALPFSVDIEKDDVDYIVDELYSLF